MNTTASAGLTRARLEDDMPDFPYGVWTLSDGSEVLFDRSFRGMYRRRQAGDRAERCARQYFNHAREERFWIDQFSPDRDRKVRAQMVALLQRWGLPVPPPRR